jgi:hypothetical protein
MFELDHVFVAASSGGSEIEDLLAEGFIEGGAHDHPGQGTASRGIFFHNAYLEFIWLTDSVTAGSSPIRRTKLLYRADPANPANPFGICFRSDASGGEQPPFETWRYRPPYLPDDLFIPVGLNSERLDEPMLFFLSWRSEPPPDPPDHPNASKAITRIALEFPSADPPSPELQAFAKLGLVQIDRGAEPLLRVELDGGRRNRQIDLRPSVPVVVSL